MSSSVGCLCQQKTFKKPQDCGTFCGRVRNCLDSLALDGNIDGIGPVKTVFSPEHLMEYVVLDAGQVEGMTLVTAPNPNYDPNKEETLYNQKLKFVRTDLKDLDLSYLFEKYLKSLPGYGSNATLTTDSTGELLWSGGEVVENVKITSSFPEESITLEGEAVVNGSFRLTGNFIGNINIIIEFDDGTCTIYNPEAKAYDAVKSGKYLYAKTGVALTNVTRYLKFVFTTAGTKTAQIIVTNIKGQELATKELRFDIVLTTRLSALIEQAQTILEEGTATHTNNQNQVLEAAIVSAQEVLENGDQDAIDNAILQLQGAITIYLET